MLEKINEHRKRLTSNLKCRQDVHILIRELGIQSGYRPLGTPLKSCLASATVFTNETFNIWTHALPAIITVGFTAWFVHSGDSLGHEDQAYAWPCLYFLFATILHLTVSSLAHTFNSISFALYQICFFGDYTAISITGLSIAVSNDAYAFASDLQSLDDKAYSVSNLYRRLFLPVAASTTILFAYVSCSERYKMHFFRLKASILVLSLFHYFWVYFPVVQRLVNCDTLDNGHPCESKSINNYYRHLILMVVSGLIFGSHFPEILRPGKYDFVGHSHQVFHVLNFFASISMFCAIHADMEARKSHEELSTTGSRLDSVEMDQIRLAIMLVVPVINICIMASFIRKVLKNPKSEKQK